MEPEFAALELRDRAVRFIAERGAVNEDEVLQHVYGGPAPEAVRARLAAPLRADPRLERLPEGAWRLRDRAEPASPAFVALALAATGPTPARARVVRVCALQVRSRDVVGRFDATLNPERRVPRYVAERAGVEADVLNDQALFTGVIDELIHFVGDTPVLAQDAQLAWEFIDAEARRIDRVLVRPKLVDVNDLAAELLALKGKPSLALIAAELGISTIRVTRVDEEARVLGLVGSRLSEMAVGDTLAEAAEASTVLRRGATARSLPDEPGVYVLRDSHQTALYVGKARRLSARLAAYVHRPLGPTRHLEGLTGAVQSVDSTKCATDLEALILEEREIRRLQPRFNTVRQQRPPRYWIRAPQTIQPKRALPRLELSSGPGAGEGQFIGPFRNEMLADQARQLAREVFELDTLRHADPELYVERLERASAFLGGDSRVAEALARGRSVSQLRQVVSFNVADMLLPADPRQARYAVLRPGAAGVEGFLIDRAVLANWTTWSKDDDVSDFARRLLSVTEPRTMPDDSNVVLRWFGAQRPPARLVWLPDDDGILARDAIEDAVFALSAPEA